MPLDFNEMISNHLKREMRPKTIGRYYPSEVGSCLRKSWYSYKKPKETDIETVKIFEMGNIVHNFVVDVLNSEKNPHVELIEAESPFLLNVDNFIISGRIDDIILVTVDNQKALLEVKSTSRLDYVKEPQDSHVMQLQLYLYAKKMTLGYVLYIEKNTLQSKIFEVQYDENKVNEILDRFRAMDFYLKQDQLPPAESKMNEKKGWMCASCPYFEECEKEKNQ